MARLRNDVKTRRRSGKAQGSSNLSKAVVLYNATKNKLVLYCEATIYHLSWIITDGSNW